MDVNQRGRERCAPELWALALHCSFQVSESPGASTAGCRSGHSSSVLCSLKQLQLVAGKVKSWLPGKAREERQAAENASPGFGLEVFYVNISVWRGRCCEPWSL